MEFGIGESRSWSRNLRRLRTRGIVLACTVAAIFVAAGTGYAQLTSDDIDDLRQRSIEEGWTFEVGENSATVYSLEDLCGLQLPFPEADQTRPIVPSAGLTLPSSFDWRELDGCPPIRNQGGCGSCWAFATVGVLECAIKIREGTTVNLSEQWLVSCTRGGTCAGGNVAHKYHMLNRPTTDQCDSGGAILEVDFPYRADDIDCTCPHSHPYYLNSWAYVDKSNDVPNTPAIKQAIMEHGPLYVAVHANNALQAYSGGIFNACDAQGSINHAVILVGWDDTQGEGGVWFMRNSWGTGWGEGGYVRMKYGCSRLGYGANYIDYRPIHASVQNNFGDAPLTVDFQASADWAEVDSFHWDFGDGCESSEQNPTHTYNQAGEFSATVSIFTPDGQLSRLLPGAAAAHGDTIVCSQVDGLPMEQVRVDFCPHNSIPLHALTIPFSWDGPFFLDLDSISTEGLRTADWLTQSVIHYDEYNRRATVYFETEPGLLPDYMEADTTAVFSAFFTIPRYVREGVNPVTVTSYSGYFPNFVAANGEYVPEIIDGSINVDCCKNQRGNVDYDMLDIADLGDLTALIDYLFISFTAPECLDEANVDADPEGNIDLGDLTRLIDYLFISLSPPPDCP